MKHYLQPMDGPCMVQEIRERELWADMRSSALETMKSVERMSVKMQLLRDSIVYHSQCNYLVQIFSKGIQEVKETLFLKIDDRDVRSRFLTSNKTVQLLKSLRSLHRDLMSAVRLLQACGGKKWKRAAIVLSMPPPQLEKYTGSTFFFLIRDFNWSLDSFRDSFHLLDDPQWSTTTEQTFGTEELMKSSGLSRHQSSDEWKFEWCHRRCRYKLQRNVHASERKVESHEDDDQQAPERGKDEIKVATEARSHEDDVDQQAASDCKDVTGVAVDSEESLEGDFDRQAQDRKSLPGIVEKTLTARACGSSLFHSVWQLRCNTVSASETPANKFLSVVKNRCQDTSGAGSADLVSKSFEIDYFDLKMEKIHVAGGAYKRIFRASWLGQEVAVAVVKHIPRDVVEKEAGFLVKVHHPNVVDFFAFALKEEALTEEEMAAVEEIEPRWTGYLVMELMQEDLRSLIDKLLRSLQKQEYGGPFSLSITVDILLQIVGAMIHTHKLDILHRDLKAKNCLVSPKFVSISKARGFSLELYYYTVKLIDFGESKLWAKDGKQTLKKGTVCWMAPEVWQSSEYSKSADVYSFGMTCYEVVTGLTPFQGIRYRVMEKVLGGIRPTIPGTCPQSLSDLMKKCWVHTPEDRPTFEELQKDLWAIKLSVDVPIQA